MAELAHEGVEPLEGATTASFLRKYGAFALALYMLATAKWGSYLPFGVPPYVGDLVLAALVAERVLAAAANRPSQQRVDLWVGLTGIALITWSVIVFAFGHVSRDALRDAAPYLYSVAVFLVPMVASPRADKSMTRALTAILVFHAAWVTVYRFDPSLAKSTSQLGGEIFLFQARSDFDGMVCGLLAAISLHRALIGRSAALNLALAGWGTTLALSLGSRAGLLAFLTQLAVVLWLSPARIRLTHGRDTRVVIAALLICLPIVYYGSGQSFAVERLRAGLQDYLPLVSTSGDVGGARGTVRARRESWQVLERYLQADSSRNFGGVGFGPNFLRDSGADQKLLGGENLDVRSPHNYLLNTWARLGLIGLVLSLALILAGFRLARRVVRSAPELTDIDVLAVMCAVSIPVAAVVGVILESPFGALPYFWSLGHLSSRALQLGVAAPILARARVSPRPARAGREPGWAEATRARRHPS